MRSFEVLPGSRYTDDAVRRGIRKLFSLGLFDDVWVTREPRGAVVDLVIHVVERRRITKIEFSGQKKKDKGDLEKKLFVHVGESYSPVTTKTQIDTLLKVYKDDGYAMATIDAVTDTTTGPGQMTLRFVVHEGEKVKIETITFEGTRAFSAKRLRKVMKTKQKGFFGGGQVDDEHFAEDRDKLESWYHDHGYRDARVLGHELTPAKEPKRLVMHVKIDEGPKYAIGKVDWQGNHVLTDAEVAKYWTPKPGEVYSASKIDRTRALAFSDYAEKGYLYVGVEPREEIRDSLVDVTFRVGEGEPSDVRYVVISGNHGTREKVIRRELDIHEGERFKRSALVRTHDNLMRLGIFEDVGIDFGPTDSSDVDVLLKVKEKQVGTASAGAGYTSQTGVTGFLELGHNNVLGNGQSLNLHLERGSATENYYLQFTEPWFRDTPTLLGVSVFDTQRQLDQYDEKRIGGSVRLGRPLPWPDYSRGSISYSLEGVEVDSTSVGFSEAERVAFQGIRFGEKVTTSSVEFGFLRNSANHPLYPTKGTRLSFNSELAGGPFGGQADFHKHRIEGRAYLRSFAKGITTMVRARIGMMGEYAGQSTPSPEYERFRLGGGTTPDPLRGYDDYTVVPDKFDRLITTFTKTYTKDTLGVVIDSTLTPTTQRVRYPGGRFFTTYSVEQQFPIVNPLHGVVFFDAGNVWDLGSEIQPFKLKKSVGAGLRLEIPLLGNIGFDYGYGFNRDDGPRFVGHFLLGNVNF